MAHIRRHPVDRSKWQVRYLDPWRRERSRTFERKVDVAAFLAEVQVAVRRGEYLDPARSTLTLAEFSQSWLETRLSVRPSTLARDESYVANYILPSLGKVRLSELSFEHAQSLVADLVARGLAPGTVRKAHQLLAQILDQAVKARRIGWNPARGVDLPATRAVTPRFLTAGEVDRLADTVDLAYRALVLLGGYAGLRWGEAAGLRVASLDLLHSKLSVDQVLNEVRGDIMFGPPKTSGSVRRVALPPFLVDELAAHLAQYPAGPDGLVFTSPDSSALRRTKFRRRVWLPGVAKAGLTPLRFHDLRHTHVALLISEGAHPKLIADRLGHSSPIVTMSVYAHLFDGLDEDIAERLDKAHAAAATDPPRTRAG